MFAEAGSIEARFDRRGGVALLVHPLMEASVSLVRSASDSIRRKAQESVVAFSI